MDEQTISVDPLALTLASLSWSGWNSGTVRLNSPWGIDVPDGNVSIYAVRHGRCMVSSSLFPEPIEAVEGDILLFPHGHAHSLRDHCASPTRDYRVLLRSHGNGHSGLDHPLAPSTTELVFGQMEKHSTSTEALHANLSSFLKLNVKDYELLHSSHDLFALMESEQRSGRPGWQAIVNQYVQVLFHQALRAFVSCNRGAPSVVDAPHAVNNGALVTDPVIGLVVGLLHAQPDKPWTVASLARWVNMSRSAFSERFREVAGSPPLHYLTELRMSRACQLLRGSDLGVKQIAGLVGYESPSSFTNAFKRWHGVSPATYRVHGRESQPCEC